MKRMLRALAFTGILGVAAVAAQAQVGVYIGSGPAYYGGYVPPSPGVDFVWTPGYYVGSVWTPGRWVHRDGYVHVDHGYYGRGVYDRGGWNHGGDHRR